MTDGSIQRVDLDTGAVETLYTECDGRALRGPNDIVFDRHGGFYFTDLGKGRVGELDRGAIYYATTDGTTISTVAFPLLTPNGIGLSPEEDRVYFAETATGRVWYWELESPGVPRPAGPQISSSSVQANLLANVGGVARLDSLAVDSEGNVCVATLDGGRSHRHRPGRPDPRHRARSRRGPHGHQHLFRRRRAHHRVHHRVGQGHPLRP